MNKSNEGIEAIGNSERLQENKEMCSHETKNNETSFERTTSYKTEQCKKRKKTDLIQEVKTEGIARDVITIGKIILSLNPQDIIHIISKIPLIPLAIMMILGVSYTYLLGSLYITRSILWIIFGLLLLGVLLPVSFVMGSRFFYLPREKRKIGRLRDLSLSILCLAILVFWSLNIFSPMKKDRVGVVIASFENEETAESVNLKINRNMDNEKKPYTRVTGKIISDHQRRLLLRWTDTDILVLEDLEKENVPIFFINDPREGLTLQGRLGEGIDLNSENSEHPEENPPAGDIIAQRIEITTYFISGLVYFFEGDHTAENICKGDPCGDYEKAVEQFGMAIELVEDSGEGQGGKDQGIKDILHFYRGRSLYYQAVHEEEKPAQQANFLCDALTDFDIAEMWNPDDAWINMGRGVVFMKLIQIEQGCLEGRGPFTTEDALAEFHQALNKADNAATPGYAYVKPKTYFHIGNIYLRDILYEDEEYNFQETIDKDYLADCFDSYEQPVAKIDTAECLFREALDSYYGAQKQDSPVPGVYIAYVHQALSQIYEKRYALSEESEDMCIRIALEELCHCIKQTEEPYASEDKFLEGESKSRNEVCENRLEALRDTLDWPDFSCEQVSLEEESDTLCNQE